METEIEIYSSQIRSLLERVCACLDGLSEAQLNQGPSLDGANSAYVLVAHTLGNARAWALGIACGQPVQRDRAAEFRALGGAADLVASAQQLSREIEAALAELSPSKIDQRSLPPKSLWGTRQPEEISPREALLNVIEHASVHLGHLQITRDLILRESA